jgi:hypothetical protein
MSETELKQKATLVDLNDLQLADEQVDLNPDADAFAGPPPPDDGEHRVKLSLGKGGVTTGTIGKGESKGKPWYQIEIVGKIQEPDPFAGRLTFNRAGTMVFNGTSEVVGILKAVGETISRNDTVLGLLRSLKARLDGEPECIQKTQWTAYCGDCNDEYKATGKGKKGGIVLRGQNRFPQEANGQHRHQIECPNCGSLVSARADVVAYRPLPPGA